MLSKEERAEIAKLVADSVSYLIISQGEIIKSQQDLERRIIDQIEKLRAETLALIEAKIQDIVLTERGLETKP